ncbi:hypothetical protein EON66_07165 [archaeon]|nr:MAG: hypothetical protein EON66_07165 [archaeon]
MPAQWVQYGAAPSVGVIVAIAVLHAVLLASVFRQLCIAEVRRFTFRVIMLSIVAVAIVGTSGSGCTTTAPKVRTPHLVVTPR